MEQIWIFLKANNLVTDRHASIAKFVTEKCPQIKHYYDCWHVAKSVSKMLKSMALRSAIREELTPDIQKSVVSRYEIPRLSI